MKSRTLKLTTFAIAFVVATLFVTLLTLNLSLGNKEIDKPLRRFYSVGSPEFE